MAYVNLGQVIYPVGAIFASTSSDSPANIFGGTWSEIVDDACLMACPENSGTYGGSKTITIAHLPPHRHTLQNQVDNFELSPADQTTIMCGQGSSKIFAWPDGQQSTYLTGGGQTTCLTPTDAICGGERLNSSDALCVISKMFKSELVQILKQFVHSQLDTSINPLTQPVQLAFMVEDGHLSQMAGSCDLKGLGIALAEKMNMNSLLQKCHVIIMNNKLLSISQETLIDVVIILAKGIQSCMIILLPHTIQEMEKLTTISPHTEHAIAGIEHPNFVWEVF